VTLACSPAPLSAAHDRLLVDLDGVVYVGDHAVPHAVEALGAARRAGARPVFVTNNASRTPQEVSAHLQRLGVPAAPDEVVTASQAGARLLQERLEAGAKVLAVGGPGVPAALREAGLTPVTSADEDPAAVMQGFGADVGWQQLTEVAFAVRAGALWVATNTDATLPTPRGPAPGNGSLVAAVRTATGREPVVAGKPEPALFELAARGSRAALVVGDRLDTDIAAANRAGLPSLLVLTGVSGPADLLGAAAGLRPQFIAADLTGLHAEHPAPCRAGDGWRCGAAVAVVRDGVLQLTDGADRPAPLDRLRAACAAVWAEMDAGNSWRPGPGVPPSWRPSAGAGR
jgi:HAD superfamily hydrolase (TIGR01450 family)